MPARIWATRHAKIFSIAVFDGDADVLVADDVEPPAGGDSPVLARLIGQAERLAGQGGDPKLRAASEHVAELVADGFNVVVFCRFIATAHYVARHLRENLQGTTVDAVTGEMPPEEREERVAETGAAEGARVLVATDCLSEGVNLQEHFDAVVHYDLSWNPTRHEQREGRVDRFGQPSPTVRATLLYGVDNPVDGAVLRVILRKAAAIREELGVPVPVPDEGHSLTQALLKTVLLRRRGSTGAVEGRQIELFESHWEDTKEKAKRSRTVFAQRRIRPDEVLPEWHRSLAAVGGRDDVQRFASRALARLGSGLEATRSGIQGPDDVPLPAEVRERLEMEDIEGTVAIDFAYPPAPGCRPVQRSHPLIAVLADTLLGRTLSVDDNDTWTSDASTLLGRTLSVGDGDTPISDASTRDPSVLGRVGCWISEGVRGRTTVALLRLRHQLLSRSRRRGHDTDGRGGRWRWPGLPLEPTGRSPGLKHSRCSHLLPPAIPRGTCGNASPHVPSCFSRSARRIWRRSRQTRAEALLEDHLRVREASRAAGSTTVQALPRPDVIGVYVLLPKVD